MSSGLLMDAWLGLVVGDGGIERWYWSEWDVLECEPEEGIAL